MMYRLISMKEETGEVMIGMKSFDKDSLKRLAKKLIKDNYECEIVEVLDSFK